MSLIDYCWSPHKMSIFVKWRGSKILRKTDLLNTKLIRLVAATISRRAKQYCPVKTGTLRRSIRHKVTTEEARVSAGGEFPGVGSPVKYAGYVELGTHKQAAQPYLRPAVESFSTLDLKVCIQKLKGA